ncbi:MAG: hypothetical protein PHV93_03525 [Candidatus Pacebacteria bacterium]|nr:hypothetical protein [Candidatus Paceibacterota bacterium]
MLVGGSIGLGVLGLAAWFMFWVTFVDNYEFGFAYDKFTGKIEPIEHTGWVSRTPWRYSVHTIDLRPYQLSISANSRVLNAKLVRFNPKGIDTFVEWHGRSAGDKLSDLQEILKCYAFDRAEGRDCPFLTVIQELAPGQGMPDTKETKVAQ